MWGIVQKNCIFGKDFSREKGIKKPPAEKEDQAGEAWQG